MTANRLIFLFLILLSSPSWAATYYVDSTGGSDSDNGLSHAQAWRTVTKVESTNFQPGDNIYFLCNRIWSGNYLVLDNSGTSSNYITYGAYYLEGGSERIGVSGTRPIFQGTMGSYPVDSWTGMIQGSPSYVKVENVIVRNSNGVGIHISGGTGFVIQNCLIYNCWRQGTIGSNTNYFLYWHNEAYNVCQIGSGAVITCPGSHNARILYNYHHDSEKQSEGINAYRSTDMEVAYNYVKNVWAAGLYMDQAIRPHFHHNFVWWDDNTTYWRYSSPPSPAPCIWIADEPDPSQYYTGGNIHHNICVNTRNGLYVDTPLRTTLTDTHFYNNTLIPHDNGQCFTINQNTHQFTYFSNNVCLDDTNPVSVGNGVYWSYNVWSAPTSQIDDDAEGTGDTYSADIDFINSTWDGSVDLTPASVYLQSTSDAIGAGIQKDAQWAQGWDVNNTDMSSIPFDVRTVNHNDYSTGGNWTAGAAVYMGGYIPPPPTAGSISRTNPTHTQGDEAYDDQLTFSHTTDVDPTYARVTVFWRNDTTETVSSVTYNGLSMTASLASTNAYTYGKAATFYMLDASLPTAGTHNIVVTMSGEVYFVEAIVETFTSVTQSAPTTVTPNDDTGDDGSVTTPITATADGSWILDSMINDQNWQSATADSAQTEIYNSANVGKRVGISSKQVDAGATSMSWTVEGTRVQHLVEMIEPAVDTSCASSEVAVDESGNTGNGIGLSLVARGGSFTVPENIKISSFTVVFTSAGHAGEAEIRWGTSPNLSTGYTASATDTVTTTTHDFNFTTKGDAVTGTTYYYALVENSGTLIIERQAGNPYANGDYWYAAANGWNMTIDSTTDPAFIINSCVVEEPNDIPTVIGIGTWRTDLSPKFSASRTEDFTTGNSLFVTVAISEQITNFGTPGQARIAYQVDYPASTTYYGVYSGQYEESGAWYLVFELIAGFSWDGAQWVSINAMRELTDLTITSIEMGDATMTDGDGNALDTTLGAHTDPGTITLSCPGSFATTDPTTLSLLDGDTIILNGGSANWTPTEDELTVMVRKPYSGNIDLTGVATPCRLIGSNLVTGTLTEGSCTATPKGTGFLGLF